MALLTGPGVAAMCGVKPSTVRSWHRRGLLKPAGLTARGWPLFDKLDAAKVEAATAARAGRI